MKTIILAFSVLAILIILNFAVVQAACECKGCKWYDGLEVPQSCDNDESPHLKCERGYYEKKDKTDYNFSSFTYKDGEKKYKQYDCQEAIRDGRNVCIAPPDGAWSCDPIDEGCTAMDDGGEDVPTECSDSPC